MENLKLRVILYGKEANSDLTSITNQSLNNFARETKYKKEYLNYTEKNNWEYLVFSYEISNEVNDVIKTLVTEHSQSENMNEANEEIKKILEKFGDSPQFNEKIFNINNKYRKFYDVIVFLVNSLSDDDSKLAFKFFQNLSEKRSAQPFLLFLTKKEENPNVEEFYESITNEFFDKRNVFAFKFPKNEHEYKNLNDFFIKCRNYYHEYTTYKSESSHSFNILICGPAGVGKSSFINQFLKEKQAKEGEGMSVTHNITKYYHPLYPITLFDTPGFEDDETVNMVLNLLNQFEKDIFDSKNHIDLILYYTKLNERTFLNLEIELIKKILSDNKDIIFVLNSFGKGKAAKNSIRLKNTFKDSLEKIIKGLTLKKKPEEILKNIQLVNQIQSTDEDDDGNPIIKQCYGMDELFQNIYNIFKNEKITTNEILNSSDMKSFIDNIQKYSLLHHIQKIEDISINLKIEASKKILDTSRKLMWWKFSFFNRDSKRKELLKEIQKLYKKDEDIDNLYSRLEYKVKNLNEKETISKFFKSIERFKGTFKTEGFLFDAWYYNDYTISIGYNYLIEFEKEYTHYDDNSKNFIKEFSLSINKAIDSFEEISKEWKDVYDELKSHKTNKGWVKRFFIVEAKK